MIKYLSLIWRALFFRRVRTLLALFSIASAFLLFGMMDSVRTAFRGASDSMVSAERMVTSSRVSFAKPLPVSLLSSISSLQGISSVGYASFFVAMYQGNSSNPIATVAISDNLLDLFPEYQVSDPQRHEFATTRTAAIVGEALLRQMGWKVGDRVPLQVANLPQMDGNTTWTLDLVGTFRAKESSQKGQEQQLFFHWSYLDEARVYGKGGVGWYTERLTDKNQSGTIAQAIDALSVNSAHQTKTRSEEAYAVAVAGQLGDIGLIVGGVMGAVFFTMIFLVANTMSEAVRQRIPDFAILKTIGFSNRRVLSLVMGESVLLTTLGGCIGLGIAAIAVSTLRNVLGQSIPMSAVDQSCWIRGVVLMTAIGLIAATLPGLRVARLRIVEALAD
jgi:putative ABC transport system permease protein